MGKLDQQLIKELDQAKTKAEEQEVPVILHFEKGMDLKTLIDAGFKMNKVFDEINVASGTVTAASVKQLTELEQVTYIEFDGQVRALQ